MIAFRLKEVGELNSGLSFPWVLKLAVQPDETSSRCNVCKIIFLRTLIGQLDTSVEL